MTTQPAESDGIAEERPEDVCLELKGERRYVLFWVTGFFTLLNGAVIACKFFGVMAIYIFSIRQPESLNYTYLTILGLYVGATQVSRLSGSPAKHRGEYFFFGWLVFLAILMTLSSLGVGDDATVTGLWWNTIVPVGAMFFGNEAMKNGATIIASAKQAWANIKTPSGS